jgi:hypothetical protein
MSPVPTNPKVWAQLAARFPLAEVQWRQDGKPIERKGKFFARFVPYLEAHTVRARLDSLFPGQWDLTMEALPLANILDKEQVVTMKAQLQIAGVIREDVGSGPDYKQAATDAFKRVATRFGIGHELYSFGNNWVEIDGEGKYAKPLEDPSVAYERAAKRHARAATGKPEDEDDASPSGGGY